MKNPLRKRYKRELRQDLGKYIAIFLFMVLSIGFISGFLVAGTSMKTAYNQSFKKYNIEDGHFILKEKADKDLIKTLQDDEHVKLYSQPYIEEKATDDNTYRIYANRSKVNKISVLSGRMGRRRDHPRQALCRKQRYKGGRLYPAQRNIVEGLRTGGIFGLQRSF